jgi:hypothetical protein
MTQQEIFQNMTKGEVSLLWSNGIPYILDGAGRYIATVHSLEDGKENDLRRAETNANAEMFVSLWNNVAAKGINPESVEKMKKAIQFIVNTAMVEGQHVTISLSDFQMLEEVLTNSKLQP